MRQKMQQEFDIAMGSEADFDFPSTKFAVSYLEPMDKQIGTCIVWEYKRWKSKSISFFI